jgi:hypothetical protein
LKRVQEDEPTNAAAKEFLKLVERENGGNFTLDRTVDHEGFPGYQIDVWHGGTGSVEPWVAVLRRGTDFRGAMALERSEPTTGQGTVFDLRYYDFDATPLALTYFGARQPDDSELLRFAQTFNAGTDGGGRYTLLRAELESLHWQRAGVAPFAALWAQYASNGSKMMADRVQTPLQKARQASWEMRGQESWGTSPNDGYSVLPFANKETQNPEQLIDVHGTLEHFHIAVLSKRDKQYLGSFQITSSDPFPGERLYQLNFVVHGEDHQVKRYDDLQPPTLTIVLADVRKALLAPAQMATRAE